MAERRMFAKTIIDSDAFLDMPLSTQALYFHLSMRADDDGFINNPKKIQRVIGGSDDDMKLLILKKFIIPFESGIVVIKHWKIHNYIQKDRYKPTVYHEEKSRLNMKSNKVYTLKKDDCIQDVYNMEAQVRLGKARLELGKSEREYIDEPDEEETAPAPPPNKLYGKYKNVSLSDEELQSLKTEYSDYEAKIDRLSEYMKSSGKGYDSHYATICIWAKEDKNKKPQGKNNFPQRNYEAEALERMMLNKQNPPKTVADCPELAAEAEQLKKELQEKYK